MRTVLSTVKSFMHRKKPVIEKAGGPTSARYRAVEYKERTKHATGIEFSLEQILGMPLAEYVAEKEAA